MESEIEANRVKKARIASDCSRLTSLVKGRFANAMFPGQILDGNTGFLLLENGDNLGLQPVRRPT